MCAISVVVALMAKKGTASVTKKGSGSGMGQDTVKKPAKRFEQWFKIVHAQTVEIMERQICIETQLRRLRRENAKIMRKLDYLVEKIGKETGDPYVPTEEDLKGDTDEEEGSDTDEEEDE